MGIEKIADALHVSVCRLPNSSFDDVDLSNASFKNVNLRQSSFDDINLSGCTITDANCRDVSISHAALDGMTIDGVLVTEMLRVYRAATENMLSGVSCPPGTSASEG